MKKTFLALSSAVLLAGTFASTAFAQDRWAGHRDGDRDRSSHYDRDGDRRHDRDGDRRYDRDRDHRRDSRYDRRDRHRDQSRYYARVRYHGGRYNPPRNYRYSRWGVGSRLPMGYYGSSYYIDYRPYRLAPPPYGYRWTRVGNDVYLVSVRDGLIVDMVYSLFR